jgi:RNA 2',3'-cyclic 3'-phosphodiesterase
MARTRTFVAVDVSKAIRERLVSMQERLAATGTEVKWVEPENLHVTLLFLGEVDQREIVDVCRIVSDGTSRHAAFTMSVETVGCFPNPRRPRILWVGVGEGSATLVALHDELEIPLQELGYRREERRYTPHITLGRVKSDRSTQALSTELTRRADWKAGETTVTELLVMGSELTSTGPQYTVLGRAKLG